MEVINQKRQNQLGKTGGNNCGINQALLHLCLQSASEFLPNKLFCSALLVACEKQLLHFLMSAAPSSATINPGIIEMQMSSVTAPQHDGGQVAHFIMLLSCCPLLVCEQGSLESCCVAMYNSCLNSSMSGPARDTHRLRERQREVSEMDFVVFQKHIVYIQAGVRA